MTSNGRWLKMEDNLQWKTTSDESHLQWKTTPMEEDIQWKNQNIKRRIYKQPLIGSYSKFKHKASWPNHSLETLQMKTISKWRWP